MESFVEKSDDSKYCNFLNSKLRHGYIFASFAKFSGSKFEKLIVKASSRTHFVNE